MASPYKITDGDRVAVIDKTTNVLIGIASDHHEIHSGSSYRGGAAGTITANATMNVAILTPASGKQLHVTLEITTANSAQASFYENPSITSNGATITPRNANRNLPDSSSSQIMLKDSTVNISSAVTLGTRHIGSAGANPSNTSLGGAVGTRGEWVLKENTWYVLSVTDTSGSSQEVFLRMEWYEHTPESS